MAEIKELKSAAEMRRISLINEDADYKQLREYFIEKRENFTNEKPVCKALAEVMHGLKYEKKDYFEATEFKKIMGSKNSLFQKDNIFNRRTHAFKNT